MTYEVTINELTGKVYYFSQLLEAKMFAEFWDVDFKFIGS